MHPSSEPPPESWPTPDQARDLRLVAVDMDGTLLDGDHQVPDTFWPLAAELRARGIVLCAASGRQHATLVDQLARVADGLVVIAENGAYVTIDGVELSSDRLDVAVVHEAVRAVRDLRAGGARVGTVVCGRRTAHVETTDDAVLAEAERYYARLERTEDLLAVDDDVLKVAVYDAGSAQTGAYPVLAHLAETHQVVVSGEHWVDVMGRGTHKGAALRRVQAALGIAPAQTAAFGDYLNDLELLAAADLSFAMAGAHPRVLAAARFRAPAHTDDGVVRTLRALLG